MPFHALPALHLQLRDRIVHIEHGCPASIAALLRHLARLTPAEPVSANAQRSP